jgi:hypothetical protein
MEDQGYIMHLFPLGFEEKFVNIEVIRLNYVHMKVVHQSDLAPFRKLRNLDLSRNDLTTFEKDLFLFNPELEVIYMHGNSIFHIHPNVFDHLNKLKYLSMSSNSCSNSVATGSVEKVKRVLLTLKKTCVLQHFTEMSEPYLNDIEHLSNKSESLEVQTSANKNEIIAQDFKIEELRGDNQELQTKLDEQSNSTQFLITRVTSLESHIDSLVKNLAELSQELSKTQQTLVLTTHHDSESQADDNDLKFSIVMYIAAPCICLLTILNLLVVCKCLIKKKKKQTSNPIYSELKVMSTK